MREVRFCWEGYRIGLVWLRWCLLVADSAIQYTNASMWFYVSNFFVYGFFGCLACILDVLWALLPFAVCLCVCLSVFGGRWCVSCTWVFGWGFLDLNVLGGSCASEKVSNWFGLVALGPHWNCVLCDGSRCQCVRFLVVDRIF